MVALLSLSDHTLITQALKTAEAKTSAKISIVVRPTSTSYQSYILTYGLILGSLIALALWAFHVVAFYPGLLSVQLGIAAAFDMAYVFEGMFVRLVPRQTRHRYAAEEAMRVYHILHAHLPKDTPFVLLFVSVAERYVHVVTNDIVHRQIPGDWNNITDSFTVSVVSRGLLTSCIEAIADIATILARPFPV
jgi:putative membrane protein